MPVRRDRAVGEAVGIAILGTGQMGSGIARLIARKEGLALVGAYGRRSERAGTDLGVALGLGVASSVPIESDLAGMLERSRPRVAIQATCSRLTDAEREVATCLEAGVHVISIAEEMTWPAARSPDWAERMDRLAEHHGVVLIGAGVNPGFVLDFLVVALSGVCARIDAITARRVNDLSPYGPSVLGAQGVGLTPEAFRAGVEEGAVVGHIGFPESIAMIASALGWEIDEVEETREPIVSQVRRETPFALVPPGHVAGCLHTAVARRDGRPVITLLHPQQIHPGLEGVETGDRIEISGEPDVCLGGSPEIPGGVATAALAVNLIPRVLAAPPGLRSMLDVPVPAAIRGAGV